MNDTLATPAFDRTREDVGNIVEFGHVNTRVPDQRVATLFYVMGLGLTRDPYLNVGIDNMWVNAGSCQFHLPTGPAQVLSGVTGLVLPDLDALEDRLKRVSGRLRGTMFSFARHADRIETTCPWGNRITCHPPSPEFGPLSLGMPYVALDAPVGTAAGIARFYREILDTPAHLERPGEIRVPVGASESLIFRETDTPLPDFDGSHVQIALANFSGPHQRLLGRGLITEESSAHQYRFQDIVDLDTGAVLLRLEHEVRSMRHPLFARPLVNRDPSLTVARFARGHEDLAWAALA